MRSLASFGAPVYLDPSQAALLHIELRKRRGNGARVSRIQIEVRGEDREALGIRSLDEWQTVSGKFGGRRANELRDLFRREMLDDLSAEDAIQHGIRKRI